MGFDVKALIAKIETMVNGENSPASNGKIDTPQEVSIFRTELDKAVETGQLTEESAAQIFGLEVKGGVQKKAPGTKDGDGDGNGNTYIFNNNITINITVSADIQAIIDAMTSALNQQTQDIIAAMQQENSLLRQTIEALVLQVINKMDENSESMEQFLSGLVESFAADMGLNFNQLYALMNTIIEILEEHGIILQDIDGNIVDLRETMVNLVNQEIGILAGFGADLSALLAAVRAGNEQDAAHYQQEMEWYSLIYDAIMALKDDLGNFSAEVSNGIQAMMALFQQGMLSLDDIRELLQYIKDNTDDINNNTAEILAQLVLTRQDIENLKTSINNSNAENKDEIIAAINSLHIDPSTGTIDLSSLEAMLAQLIQLVTAGNNTLTEMNSRMNLLVLTTNSIKNILENLEIPNYEDLLNQILDALGNNSPYDDSQVLALLQAILDAINACCGCGNSGSNEGVINDDPTNELRFLVGTQSNGGGVNQPGSNTFTKDGEGANAAIQYILAHPEAVLNGNTNTGGDDNGGNVGIDDVEQQKSVKIGNTAKVSKTLRPELNVVFDKLGIQDNQVYMVRLVNDKNQVQVFDLTGRPRGVVTLTEQEIAQLFKY